jgi:hypothetical protein
MYYWTVCIGCCNRTRWDYTGILTWLILDYISHHVSCLSLRQIHLILLWKLAFGSSDAHTNSCYGKEYGSLVSRGSLRKSVSAIECLVSLNIVYWCKNNYGTWFFRGRHITLGWSRFDNVEIPDQLWRPTLTIYTCLFYYSPQSQYVVMQLYWWTHRVSLSLSKSKIRWYMEHLCKTNVKQKYS